MMLDTRLTEFQEADFDRALHCHRVLLTELAPFLTAYDPQDPATIGSCFRSFRRSGIVRSTIEDYRKKRSIQHVLYPVQEYNCCTMSVLAALATCEGLLPNFNIARMKIVDLFSQDSPHAAVQLINLESQMRTFDMWTLPMPGNPHDLHADYHIEKGTVLPVAYEVQRGVHPDEAIKGYLSDFSHRMATCKL